MAEDPLDFSPSTIGHGTCVPTQTKTAETRPDSSPVRFLRWICLLSHCLPSDLRQQESFPPMPPAQECPSITPGIPDNQHTQRGSASSYASWLMRPVLSKRPRGSVGVCKDLPAQNDRSVEWWASGESALAQPARSDSMWAVCPSRLNGQGKQNQHRPRPYYDQSINRSQRGSTKGLEGQQIPFQTSHSAASHIPYIIAMEQSLSSKHPTRQRPPCFPCDKQKSQIRVEWSIRHTLFGHIISGDLYSA